jgi:hypothetical protein
VTLFRPRTSRGPRKSRGKGKEKERDTEEDPTAALPNATIDEIIDPDDDLYNPAPLPPNPTGPQIRSALHDKSIANICNQAMEVDLGPTANTYDTNDFPEAWNQGPPGPTGEGSAAARPIGYSPSCPQSGAANETLA